MHEVFGVCLEVVGARGHEGEDDLDGDEDRRPDRHDPAVFLVWCRGRGAWCRTLEAPGQLQRSIPREGRRVALLLVKRYGLVSAQGQ
jgi:hypothetical protein